MSDTTIEQLAAAEDVEARLSALQGQFLGLSVALAVVARAITPEAAQRAAGYLAAELEAGRMCEAVKNLSFMTLTARQGTAEAYLELLRARAGRQT